MNKTISTAKGSKNWCMHTVICDTTQFFLCIWTFFSSFTWIGACHLYILWVNDTIIMPLCRAGDYDRERLCDLSRAIMAAISTETPTLCSYRHSHNHNTHIHSQGAVLLNSDSHNWTGLREVITPWRGEAVFLLFISHPDRDILGFIFFLILNLKKDLFWNRFLFFKPFEFMVLGSTRRYKIKICCFAILIKQRYC